MEMEQTMPDLIAPVTITLRDAKGTVQTINVAAPVAIPIPPVPPVGHAVPSVVKVGSTDWIMRSDNIRLDITAAGIIRFGGTPIPGSDGSSAVGYDPKTNSTYRQAAAGPWLYWGGSMTDPKDWHAPSPAWTPDATAPPVPVPPASGSPRARMMSYLQSLAGKCLIGQTTHPDNDQRDEFKAVTQAFGFSPAIMFCDPWLDQWAGNAPYNPAFMPAALAHAKSGGIFGMSLLLPNPVDNGPSIGGPAVDPVQLFTPGSALNNSLNRSLDLAAGLLQQFKDAGQAVLTRFMLELDGPWFWWGYGHLSHADQTRLFRYIVNYLRVTKGLDNLLTTFAINGGPGDYEYPGDDLVDIVGIDAYTDDLAAKYKGTYEKLHALAPSKIFAMTEDGSGDPNGPDRTYDQNRLKADLQSALPLAVFANFWSGWGPNLATNSKAAMSDPFWINKGQVKLP
jgi:mannan endo-1,4-beta-mannosidase